MPYLEILPCLGSIAKNSRKFWWGFIVCISPLESIPFSPNSKTPLGSNNPFKRSITAGLHKFTLSINNQQPSFKHYKHNDIHIKNKFKKKILKKCTNFY